MPPPKYSPSEEMKDVDSTKMAANESSPRLPKSPRPILAHDVSSSSGSSFRPSFNKDNRDESFGADGSRGRSTHIVSRRNSSVTRSGYGITSPPREIARRRSSPNTDLRTDSRDNDSQYGGSVGQASSVYLPPTSPTSQNGEMDDIIIHRYLAEKGKLRSAEVQNRLLQTHIEDLNRHIDEQAAQAEKETIAAGTKFEQQAKMTSSHELAMKELHEQFSKQALETGVQVKEIRLDADQQINAIRIESEKMVVSLRSEFAQVQTKYATSQHLLEEEKGRMSVMTDKFKEMEKLHEERTAWLKKKGQETNDLESKLVKMQEETEAIKEIGAAEVDTLHTALDNVNEMLAFQDDKGRELSDELKLMSCQYVQNIETLDAEQTKTGKLTKELDAIEAKLKAQMEKNVDVSNQLEEMARGYIDTDELLEKEKVNVKMLVSTLETMRDELVQERSKSAELTSNLEETNKALKESSDDTLKLTGLSTSLSADLESTKKTLAKALAKVKSLNTKQKETQALYVASEDMLKNEQEMVSKVTADLDQANEKSAAISDRLADVTSRLADDNAKFAVLSEQFEEKTLAYDAVIATLDNERVVNEKTTTEKVEEIVSLTSKLVLLQKDYAAQTLWSTPLKADLKQVNGVCGRLAADLKEKTEESARFQMTLASEREESMEKLSEQETSIVNLTGELESLEKKHTILFDNLVETESKLQSKKTALEHATMQLETKDSEFKPIEDMLKEDITSKEKSLKEEQGKSLALSTELVKINKKCNSMYSNLVKTEERALQMEEQSHTLKNQLSEQEQKCKTVSIALDREKNGPVQRKLKVAMKMIQAEKDRYKAILMEVEAKNQIIGRIEKQSEGYLSAVKETTQALEAEKEKKATHSGRALQELHKQLEDERKTVKKEKEELSSMLKSEKAKVRSLNMRLTAVEGSSGEGSEVSQALKLQHENSEQVRQLTEMNAKFQSTIETQSKKEVLLEEQLDAMESKFRELADTMDTVTTYCSGLEHEKRLLKEQLISIKTNGAFIDSLLTEDDSHGDGGLDEDDEDTLDGRSLSDFSVAQIPAPRQTQRDFLRKRTTVQERACVEEEAESEDIELTVDANLLYDY